MNNHIDPDGIRAMVLLEKMSPAARRSRQLYAITPCQPFFQTEFGFYSLDRWTEEDGYPKGAEPWSYFGFEHTGRHSLGELGWCEAAFAPGFEDKVLEDRGEHELVQDFAGRGVLFFKGRRSGFMPEYVTHPVRDMATWEAHCKLRLDPTTPSRYVDLEVRMQRAIKCAGDGELIVQNIIGGYMYLRSLMGPADMLYIICENPCLIHNCMESWLNLADTIIATHQRYVTIDELFLAEDICYNNGLLISPDMVREFLFPYYRRLIANVKKRQLDQQRFLHIQIDTDGDCRPAIPLYKEIGMTVMSPFEVASGCDVVAIGKEYPDLVMSGGIDKRVLAQGRDAIDRHLDRILPAMFERGGYIPTCDHGVPAEVPLEDYKYFRQRVSEYCIGGKYLKTPSKSRS